MIDFEKMLGTLASADVKFIIVGGAAGIAHGAIRLTLDLDIVYSREKENLTRLVRALKPLAPRLRGAPDDLPFQWDEETIRNGLNFTLATTIGWIDLLGEITGGGGYEQLVNDSVKIKAFGHEYLCLKLPRLIEVKQAAGRRKDFEGIAELWAILKQTEKQ